MEFYERRKTYNYMVVVCMDEMDTLLYMYACKDMESAFKITEKYSNNIYNIKIMDLKHGITMFSQKIKIFNEKVDMLYDYKENY